MFQKQFEEERRKQREESTSAFFIASIHQRSTLIISKTKFAKSARKISIRGNKFAKG
jgi:hypothetical protein